MGDGGHAEVTRGGLRLPRLPSRRLARPGLEARLDTWAPLTVVRGLQGYGKTALVAGWLETQPAEGMIGAWVTATAASGARDRFGERLRRAWSAVGVDLGNGGGLDGLHAMLTAGGADRVVLVVDDFQHVRDGEVLAELVGLVEQYRQFHLVVSCRGRHPIELLAAGSVETSVIPSDCLLLSVEEVAQLAQVMGRPVSAEQAAQLHEAVGGWMAALRLVFASYDGSGDLPIAAAEEYLRTVVLPGIRDQATLEKVMRFSLAGHLEHGVVRELCDDADPDGYLTTLEVEGLFQPSYDGERIVLRQPTVVRDILRHAYTERHPDEARGFHRRLAAWYEAQGRDDEWMVLSMEHSIAGEDWPKAGWLWSQCGGRLIMAEPLRSWEFLSRVPAEVLDEYPGLLLGRLALGAAMGDSDEDAWAGTMRAYYETSERLVRERFSSIGFGDLVYVGTGHLVVLRMQGRFDEAERFGAVLEERLLELASSDIGPPDRLGWFYLQQGLTHQLAGADDAAIRSYQRTWDIRGPFKVDFVTSYGTSNMALSLALRGDLGGTRRWLRRHSRFDTTGTWPHYLITVGAHVAAGLLALDQLDETGVRIELGHLGKGGADNELWPFVAFLAAQCALYFGSPAKALSELDDAIAAHPAVTSETGAAVALLARARADLLTALGRVGRARLVLEPVSRTEAMTSVPLAHSHLLSGDPALAAAVAERAMAGPVTPRDRLELLLITATAALRRGNDTEAGHAAEGALSLVRETGILRALAAVPPAERDHLIDLGGGDLTADEQARLAAAAPVYPERAEVVTLTRREQEVLAALDRTGSRRQIADELYISHNTVKVQLRRIYRRLGTSTREETLSRARDLGLLR